MVTLGAAAARVDSGTAATAVMRRILKSDAFIDLVYELILLLLPNAKLTWPEGRRALGSDGAICSHF